MSGTTLTDVQGWLCGRSMHPDLYMFPGTCEALRAGYKMANAYESIMKTILLDAYKDRIKARETALSMLDRGIELAEEARMLILTRQW